MRLSGEACIASAHRPLFTLWLLAAVVLLLAGCATPVGVRPLDRADTNRRLTENVLANESLSAPTQQLLNRAGLTEQQRRDPAAAIAALRAGVPLAGAADRLFALAELSFLHAGQGGGRPHYLAAAVYAYAFLFPGTDAGLPSPFDPRLTTAVLLYNQGLAGGLAGSEPNAVDLPTGAATLSLPFGELSVRLDPEEFRWGPFTLVRCTAAAGLEVRGLRNDYRWPGLGAAMVASLRHIPGAEVSEYTLVPSVLKVPVTAFLRIDNIGETLVSGRLRGEMTLTTPQETPEVTVNGHRVPLDFRPTTALASTLEGSQVYDLELKGLLSGDLQLFKQSARFKDNVFLMAPFRPGRIPLVLVHGTASSPARWAEVLNEILNDPVLRQRYQVWLFTYNTGNPVFYSGGLLAQGLRNIVHQLDPDGRDPALRRMVIIGHSQGGLLTRLTAVDSGTVFWDSLFAVPPEGLRISPESRAALERSLFFKPLPFVRRVVFLSTPHGGSFLISTWLSNLLQRLITLPFALLSPLEEIFDQDPSALRVAGMKERIPRSTDNMSPNSTFIRTLGSLPLSPAVTAHSIIAVANPEAPRERWDDGVVSYQSAHIPGVASELVVHSAHSSQDNPAAIEEIRRILIDNLTD